jgi:type IV secretion system protein VirB3
MTHHPVPIRKSGNRDNLFLGGDRELVMFSGLCAFTLMVTAQEWTAFFVGSGIWLGAIAALRIMAKADPKMRWVYLRHRRYQRYYPAHSTPFRNNTGTQARHYQ